MLSPLLQYGLAKVNTDCTLARATGRKGFGPLKSKKKVGQFSTLELKFMQMKGTGKQNVPVKSLFLPTSVTEALFAC